MTIIVQNYLHPDNKYNTFDYLSKNPRLLKKTAKISDTAYIINQHNLLFYKKFALIPYNILNSLLFQIEKFQNNYFINTNIENNSFQEKTYFVLQTKLNGDSSYKLKIGNEIKLGSLLLKVRSIKLSNLSETIDDLVLKENSNIKNPIQQSNNIDAKCRVCLERKSNFENINTDNQQILINPCNCKGDSKYIHLSCLKKWFKIRYSDKNQLTRNCILYQYSNQCEICKGIFPDVIKINQNFYDLGSFIKPEFDNYIEFELFSNNTAFKHILICRLIPGQFAYIGKGLNNDFIFSDEDISNNHSKLFLNNKGEVFISDCNSKYGTLIAINDKLPIIERNDLFLQTGNSYIKLTLQPKKSCFSFGISKIIKNMEKYYEINNDQIYLNRVFKIAENEKIENSENVSYYSNEKTNEKNKINKSGLMNVCNSNSNLLSTALSDSKIFALNRRLFNKDNNDFNKDEEVTEICESVTEFNKSLNSLKFSNSNNKIPQDSLE